MKVFVPFISFCILFFIASCGKEVNYKLNIINNTNHRLDSIHINCGLKEKSISIDSISSVNEIEIVCKTRKLVATPYYFNMSIERFSNSDTSIYSSHLNNSSGFGISGPWGHILKNPTTTFQVDYNQDSLAAGSLDFFEIKQVE